MTEHGENLTLFQREDDKSINQPSSDIKSYQGVHENVTEGRNDFNIPAEGSNATFDASASYQSYDAAEEPPPPDGVSGVFDEVLGEVHEKALSRTGYGRLQWIMLIVCGLAMMGDSIELFVIAYIMPGAEQELCMDEQMKGWLGAIAFAGMMLGAPIWGHMADNVGRRITLLTALIINAIFSIVAAFVPSYWMLLVARLLSGLGIGGSIPVMMSYFAEFCPHDNRGRHLGFLLTFWISGGVYVSGLGWIIIPRENLQLVISQDYVFESWRIFMLVCVLPIIFSLLGLIFLPESPRYLLQAGRDLEALEVYRQIFIWNNPKRDTNYEMPELELPNRSGMRLSHQTDTKKRNFLADVAHSLENLWNSIFSIFLPPLGVISCILSITWFCISFGYFGLTIWFPEYMKKLEQDDYESNSEVYENVTYDGQSLTGFIDNKYFYNSTFLNVAFHDAVFKHVIFDGCIIKWCTFENITARKSYFLNSIIDHTSFNFTNFYGNRFLNTVQHEVTMENLPKGCDVDFDISYNVNRIFLENFIGQLVAIPCTILTALFVDRIGRVKMLSTSLFVSGVSIFFIAFANTEYTVVAMNCIFNFFIYFGWNCIDIVSTELYPTQLRSTGFGFLSSLGRIAAILGNVTFGNFIATSKAIPILLTAALLAMAGTLTTRLPESKNNLM